MEFTDYHTRLAAYVLLVDEDERVLLAWWNGEGHSAPEWSLPGGGIDFEESIRDEATLPLRFETRSVDLRIDRKALDEEFEELTRGLSEEDRAEVSKRAGRFALLVKSPARVAAVVADAPAGAAGGVAPGAAGATAAAADKPAKSKWNRKNPFPSPLAATRRLSAEGSAIKVIPLA